MWVTLITGSFDRLSDRNAWAQARESSISGRVDIDQRASREQQRGGGAVRCVAAIGLDGRCAWPSVIAQSGPPSLASTIDRIEDGPLSGSGLQPRAGRLLCQNQHCFYQYSSLAITLITIA